MHRPKLLVAVTAAGPVFYHSGGFTSEILVQDDVAAVLPHDERGKTTLLGMDSTRVAAPVLMALAHLDLTTLGAEDAVAIATKAADVAEVYHEVDTWGNVRKPADFAARVEAAQNDYAEAKLAPVVPSPAPTPEVPASPADTPAPTDATVAAS